LLFKFIVCLNRQGQSRLLKWINFQFQGSLHSVIKWKQLSFC
jgi:hypothetical protein